MVDVETIKQRRFYVGSGDIEFVGNFGFYDYYQIYTGNENNESETGSQGTDELKAVGLNSVWGVIHTLMKELNLTWDEIMWERSWINIEMMLADSARMIKAKDEVRKVDYNTLKNMFGK